MRDKWIAGELSQEDLRKTILNIKRDQRVAIICKFSFIFDIIIYDQTSA